MTTTSRITAPNPAIFTSDPLEQIFAKDMFAGNDHRGGLAYMMLNAAQSARDRDQGTYLGALEKSNETALMLSRLEEQFKHREAMAKLVAQLAPHGFLPSTMPAASDIFGSNIAGGDAVAKLFQDKTLSEIYKNRQAGAGSGDKIEWTGGIGEGGTLVDQYKYKGRDPQQVFDAAQELKRRAQINQLQGRGIPGRVEGAAKDRYKQMGQ